MNTFTRKSLYAALAGLGALGATGAAQAVNVNPNGLGSALIYPYYTTRADSAGNAYNSLLSVVNSTGSAKAVKVRFLEGKNSREVLDFNLFLSRFDVWTAAIEPTATGAKFSTTDRSCTIPPIPAGGVEFVNFAYTGASDDKGGATLDRTREGYVEIIEMATYDPSTVTWDRVTHDPPGDTPPGCAANNDTDAAVEASPIQGGLFGGMTLINVAAGTDFTEDAVALDNFYTIGSNYNPAGVTTPDLTQAAPPVSQVLGVNNAVYTSVWPIAACAVPTGCSADPVSAVLMHDNLLNEFVLDSATHSGTDWVITFPTKRFYVNTGTGSAPRLFQRNFNSTAGSCDDISISTYDREELNVVVQDFSPPRGGLQLCWEANVLTFANSNVLASTNSNNVPTAFQNGWMRLGFTGVPGLDANDHVLQNAANTSITTIGGVTTAGNTVSYQGLPVVGFAVQTFSNGTMVVGGTSVLSNYGGNFVHKTTTAITSP